MAAEVFVLVACVIIIIIIKNECHSNIIVDRLQGCSYNVLPLQYYTLPASASRWWQETGEPGSR